MGWYRDYTYFMGYNVYLWVFNENLTIIYRDFTYDLIWEYHWQMTNDGCLIFSHGQYTDMLYIYIYLTLYIFYTLYIYIYMTIYEYIWLYMIRYDYIWLYMVIYGYIWLYMIIHDYIWLDMIVYIYIYIWLDMIIYVENYHNPWSMSWDCFIRLDKSCALATIFVEHVFQSTETFINRNHIKYNFSGVNFEHI